MESSKKDNTAMISKAEHDQVVFGLLEKINDLSSRLAWFERNMFGRKTERFVGGGQMSLFETPKTEEKKEEEETPPEKAVKEHTRKRKTKAEKEFPAHLPRETIVIEPEGDLTGMKFIGEEVVERLEVEPGRVYVVRTITRKYVREASLQKELEAQAEAKNEKAPSPILQGKAPEHPFQKCRLGTSIVALVLIEKFVDHLPYYRQMRRFIRKGAKIPESTLGDAANRGIKLLQPLYDAYRKRFFTAPYLQLDESTLRVIEKGKGKTHLGYMWVGFDPVLKIPLFVYQKGRDHRGPLEDLATFEGYLQCDGYSVYETLSRKVEKLVLVNCMAHIRREFFEAKDNDYKRASKALDFIRQLYAIENTAREQKLDHTQRLALRQSQSKPIWEAFKIWIDENKGQVAPKEKIGAAMYYALARWKNMSRYLEDGKLEIDNNLVENAIRPLAIGRKNFLFAGSHEAAARIGIMYTFMEACKSNNINPEEWLIDVLNRIQNHNINKIHELFPQNWKKMDGNRDA